MADEWRVLVDKPKHGKRYIEIEDTVNKRKYSGYFRSVASENEIKNIFRGRIKEHRDEVRKKNPNTLDLKNFEASL